MFPVLPWCSMAQAQVCTRLVGHPGIVGIKRSWLRGLSMSCRMQTRKVHHMYPQGILCCRRAQFCIEIQVPKTRCTEQCGVVQVKQCFHSNEVVMYCVNGLEFKENQKEKLKFEYFLWCKWTRNTEGKADFAIKIKPSA